MSTWIFFSYKETNDIGKAVQNTFKLESVCPKVYGECYLPQLVITEINSTTDLLLTIS